MTETKPPPFLKEDPQFKATSERRDTAARRARTAQEKYKQLTNGFVIASSLAAISAGLVLYGIEGAPEATENASAIERQLGFFATQTGQWILRICQAVTVAIAAYCAYMLTFQNFSTTWRDEREKAENLRVQRGMEALEIGHREGTEAFIEAGQFFYEYLVDDQIAYLQTAEKTHDKASSGLAGFGAVIIAFGAGAPFLAQVGDSILVLVGALAAIMTPALLAGLKSWSEATSSTERQKLHQATLDLLQGVAGKKREFDTALKQNDLQAAKEYADLVIAALKTDLEGFLVITQGAFQPSEPTLPTPGGHR